MAQTVEDLMMDAEMRFRKQMEASAAILMVEKVRILLAPLVRADVLTQEEVEAVVLARSTLESAQRRLLQEREEAGPMIALPDVKLAPGKDFFWGEDG